MTADVVKLPAMTSIEIQDVLKSTHIARIALNRTPFPQILPLQYSYLHNTVYFHFSRYGQKLDWLRQPVSVCVEIEQVQPRMDQYRFVLMYGTLVPEEDLNRQKEVLNDLASCGEALFSPNFIAVHGIDKEKGWSSLKIAKNVMIMKLSPVSEIIGLKSPYK
jgi:nitroimidazol reductase NimA-like FMN-containing flavoprotein (pyridoxamine 5'-phosphate oxidase superfamily)